MKVGSVTQWILGICLGMLALAGCTTERIIERAVVMTHVVEVTREVAVEVTREVVVTQAVEVTREVPLEITVIVSATPAPTGEVLSDTASAAALSPTLPPAPTEARAESTTVSVGDSAAVAAAPATPVPLSTTVAIAGQQSSNSGGACWTWQEAARHIGESGCVEATVTGLGASQSATFVNFSPERDTFYLVSFDWQWEELAGECLRVSGIVSEYRGRPQMIINEPSQMQYCGSTDTPPAFSR